MQLLRDIELFVEVVQARSFSRAAQRLGLPTSTVSRRIALMERTLGLQLLHRTTRRVEVTEAGAAYHARCAPLIEEARAAHENLQEDALQPKGTLRLACTPDFASWYLPDVLVRFARAHPEVDIELDLSSRRVDLHTEPVDAALRIGPLPDSALVARRVGSLRRQLFAAPGYLQALGEPEHPADLAQHAGIRLQPGSPHAQWALVCERTGAPAEPVQSRSRFVAGSLSMARELALRGAGIAALDVRCAAPDVGLGRLVRVLPGWALEPVPLHLVCASRLMPARVRAFAQVLQAELGLAPSSVPPPVLGVQPSHAS